MYVELFSQITTNVIATKTTENKPDIKRFDQIHLQRKYHSRLHLSN